MIIGHVGVRMGSKGVTGKNFRDMLGKPLIDWSLDQLLQHPGVNHVVVSTDDPRIRRHAVAKGCLDMGLRPAELATDTAAKWDVWQHALAKAEQLTGTADVFIDLDCTSPLRSVEDLDGALHTFLRERPDMVMSCTEARKNPYFNLVEPDRHGYLRVSKPLEGGVVARQQAPLVWEHAASTYVVDPGYLKSATGLLEGRVLPYLMPPERCMDIDTELDFRLVEFLMKERQDG
ncbi:MAG: acylneuraminate cytidylyltransferase family protein [Boseongicola sp. SB0677_bin_26]|nr:acylneuraminate cytidylyltransferase family protein [Boseongicola sp. SB0665_bin_10]MYG27813.1 acylneuraminate cytidylyltransferase family protein [Boseongicola sp. SB0677_bin_26]